MRVVIFRPTKSERDAALADALLTGFETNGDQVVLKKSVEFAGLDEWTQMVVLIGLADKKLYTQYIRAGKSVLLVDEGYMKPEKYYRFALDGFQSWFLHAEAKPHDRLAKLLVELDQQLKPYAERNQRCGLFVGNSHAYCEWHELTDNGDKHSYDANMCRHIAVRITPMIWGSGSPTARYLPTKDFNPKHPKFIDPPKNCVVLSPHTPILEALADCSVLVEHGGNHGVTAAIAGVPVVVTTPEGISPVYPIAGHTIEGVKNPPTPTNGLRCQILANLAWHQFSLEEIASGFALQHLAPYTIKHLENTGVDLDDTDYLVAQYKMMHNSGKYRGGLHPDITQHVTQLVQKYQPASLLDYGSGKGRQYSEFEQHKLWGGLEPHCYDPAYAPFATKPSNQFDGVLCTDVAEHIPEGSIPAFLDDILHYAGRFVFLCIYTGLAVKYLPDGRNAHLTVRKQKWWNHKIIDAVERREGKGMGVMTITMLADNAMQFRSRTVDIVVLYRGGEKNEKAA